MAGLPGWRLGDGEIEKRYELDDFRAAVAFVVRVAFEAEAADHHPDLDVRWNKVRVALATHSEHADHHQGPRAGQGHRGDPSAEGSPQATPLRQIPLQRRDPPADTAGSRGA